MAGLSADGLSQHYYEKSFKSGAGYLLKRSRRVLVFSFDFVSKRLMSIILVCVVSCESNKLNIPLVSQQIN